MNKELPSLYFLHLQFGERYELVSLKKLFDFSKSLANTFNLRKIIFIENNDKYFNTKKYNLPMVEKIAGNNIWKEFSGWQHGYNYLIQRQVLNPQDLILFSNDTFFRHRYFDGIIKRQFKRLISNKIDRPHVIGEKNVLPGFNNYFDKYQINYYLSTYFFCATSDAIDKIGGLEPPYKIPEIITGNLDPNYYFSDLLSDDYKSFLINHLFGIGNNPYWRWHNAQIPNKENNELMLKKAISIIAEHILWRRFEEKNIDIIDIFDDKKYKIERFFRKIERRLLNDLCKKYYKLF